MTLGGSQAPGGPGDRTRVLGGRTLQEDGTTQSAGASTSDSASRIAREK